MRLDFAKMQPIGVYLTDSSDLYNGINQRVHVEDKYKGYLPILNMFSINGSAEVIFSDTRDKSKEVISYNRCLSNKNLDSETIRTKRIDITHNDLYLGPIRILLNYTSQAVTVNMANEYRKTYPRIQQDQFEEYMGKIMIFSIFTLNTPALIQATTGNGNYLEAMYNKLKHRPGDEIKEMYSVYEYAESKWPLFKQLPNGCIANSIKVVCLQIVDEKEIMNQPDHHIYLRNLDTCISFDNLLEIKENPSTQIKGIGGREIQSIIKNNSFICYLVDNNDMVSDRYINLAGNVKKINKIKDGTMVNGLYMIHTGDDGKSDMEMLCTLEDIDKNEFVYRSVEEATNGANIRQKYKDEVELSKVERESLISKLKQEHDLQLLKMKADHEKNKLEMEERLHAIKLESESKKSEVVDKKTHHESTKYDLDSQREILKLESELEKYRMDKMSMRSKYYHDERRHERDTTVETLKTIGAVAGLAATGFIIYKKFIEA